MNWFWFFTIYSAMGCALEIAFALIRKARPDRKRLLFFPLCPVYGVGACLCLLIAPTAQGNPAALFLIGATVCTATEYLAAVWYERGLGVKFWDYAGERGNLWGRVCLPFSAAWGVLTLILVYGIHPAVCVAVTRIPAALTFLAAPAILADLIASGCLLRRTHDRACLRWYDRFSRRTA